MNVLVWNYRGYGRSNGHPSPKHLTKDSDVILKYLKETMGLRGFIGVYGRSLGGIVTTYLADKVEMIIADRTFCNFKKLAVRKFYSSLSEYLFKFTSCNWSANNDLNLLHKGVHTCYKVVIVDKEDEVIDVYSSLMTGVAEAFQKSHEYPKVFDQK